MASWEIECCAPPPIVGEIATWRLSFANQGDWMDPLLEVDHEWTVTPFPMPGLPRALCLADGLVRACWPEPADGVGPGRQWLRGQVFATRHGGDGWGAFPRTTTRVLRVQLVTTDVRWSTGEDGRGSRGVPVPRSTLLADLQQSPRHFSPAQLRDTGILGDEPVASGVLIDLATVAEFDDAIEPRNGR